MAYTANPRKIYLKSDSKFWYMNLQDPITGKRVRKSTHETDKDRAMAVYEREQRKLDVGRRGAPLGDLLELYRDPETNPRKRQALLDGSSYGEQYAQSVATHASFLSQMLQKKAPALYKKDVVDFTTLDVKAVKELIFKVKGQTRTAQYVFRTFKGIFSQAHQDGLVDVNVCQGMKDIRYTEKKRDAIPANVLLKVIRARDMFLNQEVWAFFVVLATTGMRLSEVLALSIEQLDGNILTIDRALKGQGRNDVGTPKWGLTRVIPLARITMAALSTLKPGYQGRLFHHNRQWGADAFGMIKSVAFIVAPEDRGIWESASAHVLRHSMNTNLLCAGESPLMVAEYLSWEHQTLLDMQQRYTHIYAQSLNDISSRIDMMLNPAEVVKAHKKSFR